MPEPRIGEAIEAAKAVEEFGWKYDSTYVAWKGQALDLAYHLLDLAAELERAHAVIEAARAFDDAALSTGGDLRLAMRAAIAAFDRQATETTT